jgi:hypothetical protein
MGTEDSFIHIPPRRFAGEMVLKMADVRNNQESMLITIVSVYAFMGD